MSAPSPQPLALTMGEPGGVGGEIAVKAWRALAGAGPAFFAIDDPARLAALGAPVAEINTPEAAAAAFSARLPVLPLDARVEARPGVADAMNAPHVISSIRRAVALALSGAASGVVTNPLQKASLIASGFEFPGHTEFLGKLTESAPMARPGLHRGPVMMIAGPSLKTVPVTVHAPLVQAVRSLTSGMIVEKAIVVAEALAIDFGLEAPRLALAGVNPHAGEDGALGSEDREIIAPAVEALRKAGVEAIGPLSADTMFHEEARARYDAAICMYHDQALIPAKTLAFHEAVNVTLGLPIVRTSPDHGTALDIAGEGIARADSLIAAIRLAGDIAARRARLR
ncbi:MAG: 4-hydroxythreonine-4-phosphate dehydrogenase PdxA [Alphaproteobacteria bacterium]|nr:4-hydroxythreonine-4-phosphate dehydrogenase PdxA [Alphaproteobacteria bacterium]